MVASGKARYGWQGQVLSCRDDFLWTMTSLALSSVQVVGSSLAPSTDISLQNGVVEAIVSPAQGRVTFFGRPGGRNLLWTNPEPKRGPNGINHGGDRVLFSPQVLWSQIRQGGVPDPTAINTPWQVLEQSKERVVLQSEWDQDLDVRMTRTISLPQRKPELTQHYRLARRQKNPFPVHIWTIAQVPPKGAVWMDVAKDSPNHHGTAYRDLLRSLDEEASVSLLPLAQAVRFQWPSDRAAKLGTFGTWLAWVEGSQGLLVVAPWQRKKSYFIDQSNLQVFTLPGKTGFLELETQTPTSNLSPGESLEHTVRWCLLEWEESPAWDEALAGELAVKASKLAP